MDKPMARLYLTVLFTNVRTPRRIGIWLRNTLLRERTISTSMVITSRALSNMLSTHKVSSRAVFVEIELTHCLCRRETHWTSRMRDQRRKEGMLSLRKTRPGRSRIQLRKPRLWGLMKRSLTHRTETENVEVVSKWISFSFKSYHLARRA